MTQLESEKHIIAPTDWWSAGAGFFGRNYMRGDNSHEGFLSEQNLDLTARTNREVEGVISLLGLEEGASILDCPCGYGRHSNALADRGFDVLGVDINCEHLTAAVADRGRRNGAPGKRAEFALCDMRDSCGVGRFDAVVNMFFSFGFFDEDKENSQVLAAWYEALRDGGQLLIHTDVNVPRITTGTYKLSETRTLAGGGKLNIRESYCHRTRRLNGTWELEDGDRHALLTPYSVRVFTAEELEEWLVEAGFRNVRAFSDWTGRTYDRASEEMLLVGTK